MQSFQSLGVTVQVLRNSPSTVVDCLALKPSWIVIGPGPGRPSEAGTSNTLIQKAAGKIPVLGVCLGHQCLGEIYGANIVRARQAMHGKQSCIQHDGKGIFTGMPQKFKATRYHSLVVERASLSPLLEITAVSEEDEIMGLRHREYLLESVQFHPESVLTESGLLILENFLRYD